MCLSSIILAQDNTVPEDGCPINTISTDPDNYDNSTDEEESALQERITRLEKIILEFSK